MTTPATAAANAAAIREACAAAGVPFASARLIKAGADARTLTTREIFAAAWDISIERLERQANGGPKKTEADTDDSWARSVARVNARLRK